MSQTQWISYIKDLKLPGVSGNDTLFRRLENIYVSLALNHSAFSIGKWVQGNALAAKIVFPKVRAKLSEMNKHTSMVVSKSRLIKIDE